MNQKNYLFLAGIFFVLISFNFCSAAHYIVGQVNDALDGTQANGHTIIVWNSSNGISDNQTDIIGPLGNSGADNIFMIDCEMLSNGCGIGEELSIKVINNGDNYVSSIANVIVSSAGYDLAPEITLNSPPIISLVLVEDSFNSPENEIDLLPASFIGITCSAVASDLDGGDLNNANGEFFELLSSSEGMPDDNNFHYSNSSCFINSSYGDENESQLVCSFNVAYYALPGNWECVIKAYDSLNINGKNFDTTYINSLLAIGAYEYINFTGASPKKVSNEQVVNITNFGNVAINLSLKGYGAVDGDELAMVCPTSSENISVNYMKYNLTESTAGNLSLSEFGLAYINLTSNAIVKNFNLNYRQNDVFNEAVNSSYWRVYVPEEIRGNCSGSLIFGAVQGAGV